MLAGRRWDIRIDNLINFDEGWTKELKSRVAKDGVLHPETGVDFFLYPKTCIPEMPNFAIGRGYWDNWILYDFNKRNIPIIDATEIQTVHQNHDYTHVKSVTKGTTKKGSEREKNGQIASLKYWNMMCISDAKYIIRHGKIVKTSFLLRLKRLYIRFIKAGLVIFLKHRLKYYKS